MYNFRRNQSAERTASRSFAVETEREDCFEDTDSWLKLSSSGRQCGNYSLGPGKRANRPCEVLELDLSGLPTNQMG